MMLLGYRGGYIKIGKRPENITR